MSNFTHRSHARWEEGVYCSADGKNISTDNHHNENEALSICRLLEEEGFGGFGKDFPIETWATPIPFEEQYPEEAETLMQICQERGEQKEKGIELEPIFLDAQQDMVVEYKNAYPSYKTETVRRVEEKVGRNDPCPCGSGKKFKKCCIM